MPSVIFIAWGCGFHTQSLMPISSVPYSRNLIPCRPWVSSRTQMIWSAEGGTLISVECDLNDNIVIQSRWSLCFGGISCSWHEYQRIRQRSPACCQNDQWRFSFHWPSPTDHLSLGAGDSIQCRVPEAPHQASLRSSRQPLPPSVRREGRGPVLHKPRLGIKLEVLTSFQKIPQISFSCSLFSS